MNKGSIVERLCSDLDRKEPRYKWPTLLYFTLLYLCGCLFAVKKLAIHKCSDSEPFAFDLVTEKGNHCDCVILALLTNAHAMLLPIHVSKSLILDKPILI